VGHSRAEKAASRQRILDSVSIAEIMKAAILDLDAALGDDG
jgi:hypothetical protein